MKTERTLQRTIIIALSLTIVSCLLIVAAQALPAGKTWLATILTNVGSFFLASVVLGVVFEVWQKKTFLEEVFAEAKIVEQIRAAGLIGYSPGFYETVDWSALFAKSTSLDIFFAYGATWRNIHQQQLEQLVSRNGARLRVVLPDPTNETVLKEMSSRFSLPEAELVRRIEEAIGFFKDLECSNE